MESMESLALSKKLLCKIGKAKSIYVPAQMEFFGEDEVITVIPTINLPTTDSSLICIGVMALL